MVGEQPKAVPSWYFFGWGQVLWFPQKSALPLPSQGCTQTRTGRQHLEIHVVARHTQAHSGREVRRAKSADGGLNEQQKELPGNGREKEELLRNLHVLGRGAVLPAPPPPPGPDARCINTCAAVAFDPSNCGTAAVRPFQDLGKF